MEDRKTKFKAWYKRFLMQTERLGIDDKTAESEAENAYSLIPEDAECDISDSKYCKLCKDDSDVREASLYATGDIGCAEPKERPKEVFKGKGGTTVPVTMHICKRCRRNYLLAQYVPTAFCAIIITATLILVCNRNVRDLIFSGHTSFVPPVMRPFFIFAIVTAVTVFLGALIKMLMLKKLKTRFDIFEVSELSPIKKNGWFQLNTGKNMTSLFFSEAKPGYLCESESLDCPENTEEASDESKDTECEASGESSTDGNE